MNIKTRLRSYGMRYLSSDKYQQRLRLKARRKRVQQSALPVVHYFHQVDDPYSHLAIQKLDLLKANYALEFQPHLVSKPEAAYLGHADHFDRWAVSDAASVASDYNTSFDPSVDKPAAIAIDQANRQLADQLEQADFAQSAFAVGEALWREQSSHTLSETTVAIEAVTQGNALQKELGHYQGGMFYFEGEWFWGVDRIRLLEARLISEGFARNAEGVCIPEPTPQDTSDLDTSGILLEYFPSLRSPYTAIGHQRVLDLIARSGVTVSVRPVMPMLMRGIPAPRQKQRYIISDAGREGRAHGQPLGAIVDPFGEPVKRAFALFAGADAMNHAMSFVTAYLQAAWFDGVDITRERGLQKVASDAGLGWHELMDASQGADWEAILAANLDAMLTDNLWGVPSFRVSGGREINSYACWGQDRIWRVENEIAKRA